MEAGDARQEGGGKGEARGGGASREAGRADEDGGHPGVEEAAHGAEEGQGARAQKVSGGTFLIGECKSFVSCFWGSVRVLLFCKERCAFNMNLKF